MSNQINGSVLVDDSGFAYVTTDREEQDCGECDLTRDAAPMTRELAKEVAQRLFYLADSLITEEQAAIGQALELGLVCLHRGWTGRNAHVQIPGLLSSDKMPGSRAEILFSKKRSP